MIGRPFWQERIEATWHKVPIVWLSGVRRAGKTTLARSIPGAHYLNCDLPEVQERLRDPVRVLGALEEPRLVLDEVHRLDDPSQVLKIAADEFADVRVLATGSSTLAATDRFRDSLTGRKRSVHLVPVLAAECERFDVSIDRRLLRGGLPDALLAEEHDLEYYAEWVASYYARDVQELFRVGGRRGFLLLLETLLRQSGGLADMTSLARAAGISRPTVIKYLDVFEVTQVAHVVRPHHGGGKQELVRQPKIYGFDTGFTAWARGWDTLRPVDAGQLWEQLVLESLVAHRPLAKIHYWRDKQKREVDFVVPERDGTVTAIECKWNRRRVSTTGLAAFRSVYPEGRNLVIVPDVSEPQVREVDGLELTIAGIDVLR